MVKQRDRQTDRWTDKWIAGWLNVQVRGQVTEGLTDKINPLLLCCNQTYPLFGESSRKNARKYTVLHVHVYYAQLFTYPVLTTANASQYQTKLTYIFTIK